MNFDKSQHLVCRDVSVDDLENPMLFTVHLERSKCDQLGRGNNVFVGFIDDPCLCPVTDLLVMHGLSGSIPQAIF